MYSDSKYAYGTRTRMIQREGRNSDKASKYNQDMSWRSDKIILFFTCSPSSLCS